jgi:DNA polymerase I-like protein with 3'-5' exonuclease and polymerase domains
VSPIILGVGPEQGWAERVYLADKEVARLCTKMQQAGFGFDPERAKTLSDMLRGLETEARSKAELAAGRKIKGGKGGGFGNNDLKKLFFEELRAPVYARSKLTGNASLGVDVMRAYAAGARQDLRDLANAILDWRRARKIRVTYIDNITLGSDGRVHPTWLSYGAVSGRLACRGPNLMNLPRKSTDPTYTLIKGGIRSLYRASRPGWVIFGFDCSQLEMRVCAYASGDDMMIAACESDDMHSANAIALFGDAFTLETDPDTRSMLRTLAKTSGFAAAYLADATTVHARLLASGVNVKLRQVEAMLRRLKSKARGYYAWQEARLLDAIRNGYVDEPILGRRRYLGHDPRPTEVANFPIQAGAAAHMNTRLPLLAKRLYDEFGALCVAQVHDAGYFEIPEWAVARAEQIAIEIFTAPQNFGAGRLASLPIDMGADERWH